MKRFTISGEWQGSRLDRFIRASFPGTPFGVTQILLRKGLIFLNGVKANGSARLKAGDVVAVNISEAEENGRSRQAAPPRATSACEIGATVPVLYEDDSILVIDKPAGLVVQPGNRADKGSLLDLLERYRLKHAAPASEPLFLYTPVHRLDRQTSGALIIAKTRPAARALSRAISQGDVLKTYLAVVEGIPPGKSGEISAPLATYKGKHSHSAPAATGKEARTSYSVLKKLSGERALLEVSIRTGRTHQIRAHLASIGHPIAGDKEYGASSRSGGKLFLHAWKLQFQHPETGAVIAVTASPPPDFENR
ncbi:MAG: RluA family pseudouridine synthase [Candidatus Krumholzibacteria bacterium]|nr:RluA family pseudouridine synthase [Candidatus Krumholzibacteria bacterium]